MMKCRNKTLPRIMLACVAVLTALVAASGCSIESYDVKLTGITVSPSTVSIAVTATQQFTAIGHYTDASTKDLTSQVTWSSSNTTAAAVSATGLATANNIASTQSAVITATEPGGMSGTATLTVVNIPLISIAVTPAAPGIAVGTGQQFTATGTYSDNITTITQDITSQVTWASSNTAVATINTSGLAASVGPGTTSITAAKGSVVSPNVTLTVNNVTLASIAVTPANPEAAKGANVQFTATGTFSDNSTQDITALVTWSSSATTVATINAAGLASVPPGATAGATTTITATSGGVLGNVVGSTGLTVASGGY